MLNDPDNEVMNQIKYGGDDALQDFYRRDIHESILRKKQHFEEFGGENKENDFLNSLNDQEYAEFIKYKKIGKNNKFGKTGVASELMAEESKQKQVQYVIQEQQLLERMRLQMLSE